MIKVFFDGYIGHPGPGITSMDGFMRLLRRKSPGRNLEVELSGKRRKDPAQELLP